VDADHQQAEELAASVAEKIRSSLARPYQLSVAHHGQNAVIVNHQCSASIGLVVFASDAMPAEIMKRADVAMYQAKAAGRNQVRLFSAD
jgi:GGDEF domain-containing protein